MARPELDENGRLIVGRTRHRCRVHGIERDNRERIVALVVDLELRYFTRRLRIAITDRFDALDAGGLVEVTGFRHDATAAFVKRSTSRRRQAIRIDRLAGTRYLPQYRRHEVLR